MEDFSHVLLEAVLKEMECPGSIHYMVPPTLQCTNGHNIVSRCVGTVLLCPKCRVEFCEIRNVALETIATSQKYPCANWQSVCHKFLPIEHSAEHNSVCVYRKIKRPFKLNKNCSWNGNRSDLNEHAKEAHATEFFKI